MAKKKVNPDEYKADDFSWVQTPEHQKWLAEQKEAEIAIIVTVLIKEEVGKLPEELLWNHKEAIGYIDTMIRNNRIEGVIKGILRIVPNNEDELKALSPILGILDKYGLLPKEEE